MTTPNSLRTDDDDDDDKVVEPAPKAKPDTAKSKMPQSLLDDAADLGVNQTEIDACENQGELRELIKDARSRIAFNERRQAATRGARQDTRAEEVEPEPKAKPKAEETEEELPEYQFENNELFSEDAQKELRRIFKAAVKAANEGNTKKAKALEEKYEATIAELKGEVNSLKSEKNPSNIAARNTMAKWPKLFGEGGVPKTKMQLAAFETIREEIFNLDDNGAPQSVKRGYTGDPTKDIPKAVKKCFDVEEEAEETVDDEQAEPKAKPTVKTKSQDWAESGLAAPTSKNGNGRPGVPGGDHAAKKKIRDNLRKRNLPIGPDDDDEDDLDDL